MSGTKKVCNSIVRKNWFWGRERGICLSACHLPGVQNVQADKESRSQHFNSEWKLNPSLFTAICDFCGTPQIDLFASRLNYQIKPFFAWKPDPEAHAIDALSQPWHSYHLAYAFPPLSH